MTPKELRAARAALGMSTNGLARTIRLGANGDRTVRRWEAGDVPISGPVSVAVELLLVCCTAMELSLSGAVGAPKIVGDALGRIDPLILKRIKMKAEANAT